LWGEDSIWKRFLELEALPCLTPGYEAKDAKGTSRYLRRALRARAEGCVASSLRGGCTHSFCVGNCTLLIDVRASDKTQIWVFIHLVATVELMWLMNLA
jgi:hypothetical protein